MGAIKAVFRSWDNPRANDALAVWYNTSGYLLIERGELMRTDKKGQNEVWLHAKPVSSDVCME